MNGLYAIAGSIIMLTGAVNKATDGTNCVLWICGILMILGSVIAR